MKHTLIILLSLLVCSLSAQNYGVIGMPGGTLQGGEMDSIVYQSSSLSSNASISTANTWTDAASITLDSGMWLINAHATFSISSGISGGPFSARIKNNTSTCASSSNVGSTRVNISLTCIVESSSGPGSTYTLQGLSESTTGSPYIAAALPANGVGNNATQITAIKLSGY